MPPWRSAAAGSSDEPIFSADVCPEDTTGPAPGSRGALEGAVSTRCTAVEKQLATGLCRLPAAPGTGAGPSTWTGGRTVNVALIPIRVHCSWCRSRPFFCPHCGAEFLARFGLDASGNPVRQTGRCEDCRSLFCLVPDGNENNNRTPCPVKDLDQGGPPGGPQSRQAISPAQKENSKR